MEFNEIKFDFHKYVISVYPHQAMKNSTPEENDMRYVSYTTLNEYYDLQTGFKTIPESGIW